MKLIIAGSRTVQMDVFKLSRWLVDFKLAPNEIVSGGAQGMDKSGEDFANKAEIKLKVFKADWKKHGKAAGPIRNREMAKYSDALFVVWDGKSKGTANMMSEMKKLNKPVYAVMTAVLSERRA